MTIDNKVKVKVIPLQAEVALGVPGRLKPRIILTFRHYNGGRSSVKRTGRLYPRRNPWYSAQGVPGSLRPRIILTFRHYKGGRSSAKRTGRLYPSKIPGTQPKGFRVD